jgi:hypothetical protein
MGTVASVVMSGLCQRRGLFKEGRISVVPINRALNALLSTTMNQQHDIPDVPRFAHAASSRIPPIWPRSSIIGDRLA